ncbi:cyclodeaminase/cyclohydrolase family protein [Deinococcus aquiradiocola]|uniref:Serine cycle enzyme n=1 Tax=Deinococcus aquiradiocola TaxID=393059 RepID=A0A917URG3_9DEIO|nr:cyclodeaminase/cyclohydrolase family protein [Deinococcus aquiradiocola]GGJ79575.1 serine cycle enzyme [Deinococcus aquiradiocola]
MSLWDLTAADLLDRTASGDPTPGGGSVAAVTGALGLGLVCMALEVTARRRTATPDVHALLARARAQLDALRGHPDADVTAFGGFMAALALPRGTDAEQAARQAALAQAAQAATRAPLHAARDLLAALQLAQEAAVAAHRGIVSDVGAGAALLGAALQATLLNVDINLGSLPDDLRDAARHERETLARAGDETARQVARMVQDRLA